MNTNTNAVYGFDPWDIPVNTEVVRIGLDIRYGYGDYAMISRRQGRSTSLNVLLLCIIIIFVYVLLLSCLLLLPMQCPP